MQRTSSGILIPDSAAPAYACQIPGCEAKFYKGEYDNFVRHVKVCAKRNRGELEELSERNKDTSAFGGPVDPEAAEWLRKRFPVQRR